jgi:hypothetical protein
MACSPHPACCMFHLSHPLGFDQHNIFGELYKLWRSPLYNCVRKYCDYRALLEHTVVQQWESKMVVFCVIVPCSLMMEAVSTYLWNVGKLLPDYTALETRRQPSSYSPPWEPEIQRESKSLLEWIFAAVRTENIVGAHYYNNGKMSLLDTKMT